MRMLPARLRATSRIAATTTKAEAAAAAITAKATSTTAATIFAWASFVDFQGASGNFFSVELLNRRSRFVVCRHFDEGEAFRLSSVPILDHAGRFNRSDLSKQLLQILAGSLEGEVSNIKFF